MKSTDDTLEQTTTGENKKNRWLIDSGASSHMTWDYKDLTDIKFIPPRVITAADGKRMICDRSGTVYLEVWNGTKWNSITLQNVLFVPGICLKLLSLCSTTSVGFWAKLSEEHCDIGKKSKRFVRAERFAGLHYLKVKAKRREIVYKVSEDDPTAEEQHLELLHRRLGHLNVQYIRKLVDSGAEGIAIKDKEEDFGIYRCDGCILGKQYAEKIKTSTPRNRILGELIHSDVCGPMEADMHGNRYYVSFIDDYSRRATIFLLKQKSEVVSKFKEFYQRVLAETGMKIQVLRSDNGGEYVNAAMENFMKENGIKHQTSVPYNPDENGVSERFNRTEVEGVRAMLHGQGMDMSYWGLAAVTRCYLYNRSPHRAIEYKTPHERWTGRKPQLQHLRVFGVPVYAHQPKQKRVKLDQKSKLEKPIHS